MGTGEIELPTREPRGSRRRPDLPPPKVERIKPRSGLSRAEVMAIQRRRILDGVAAALAYHGYEDTKITDIVELAGVSRPTFYEYFEGKEQCFAAAYGDGVERLVAAAEAAVADESDWAARLSLALSASLAFLAADPPLAHLLLVESLAASRPARIEHERSLARLAEALRPPGADHGSAAPVSEETARLLAGGLASHLSGRVLAGEAERLAESHDLLLGYLLAASQAASRSAGERRAARS
ncbi:MAG TPA: TetR/AcrR family transcriptional regulator [Solirubrobacterales bacterium]|jgi:AcrR family transcriptional regulator|nr:TetR/AcrR family transcriptional regulator [Solirubrobacterales bacterium]